MSAEPPLISVVVPNFNSGTVLERALCSVFRQTYQNYELIVADGGSTDESVATLDRYRARVHTLISEKDGGQADGLNKGFARATGDIHCWLCADDELLPRTFERVATAFRRHAETDVVIGACERVYEDGMRQVTAPPPDALARSSYINLVEQPSCFWRAELHQRVGPLDDSFHLAFDWDFWCRMHRAGARARAIEPVLSRYYFSAANKTSQSGRRFAAEAARILARYGPLHGRLSHIYGALFQHFDLHGCYDDPPACGKLRRVAFAGALRAFRLVAGSELVSSYNWHFASLQARGMKWW